MNKKNAWFKHYNMASDGHSFSQLIAEKDYETLWIYWWLLEQVSRFEDESDRGKVTLKFSYFKTKLGQNRQRFTKVLSKIAQTFKIKVEINSDETVTVFVPNWLELQENRGGKREVLGVPKTEQKPTEERRERKEDRSKNKEYINTHTVQSSFSELESGAIENPPVSKSLVPVGTSLKQTIAISHFHDFNQILSNQTKANLYELYPDFDFLKREFLKMHTWLVANPRKNKKSARGWAAFVSNWLERGWVKYTNGLPSNKANLNQGEVDERIRQLFEDQAVSA